MRIAFGHRKLQYGGGNVFLNLPTAWVRSVKMMPGDRVSVEVNDEGSLVISPSEAV